MRKIIAIAGVAARAVALCGDGTVWSMDPKGKAPKWIALPSIPQELIVKAKPSPTAHVAHLICRPGVMGKVYLDTRSNAWTQNPKRASPFDSAAEAADIAADIGGSDIIPLEDAQAEFDAIVAGPKSRQKPAKKRKHRPEDYAVEG